MKKENYGGVFVDYLDSYEILYKDKDKMKCTDLVLARMMTLKRGDSDFYD